MSAGNRAAAAARIHASEQGVNTHEPLDVGGISVNGVTLVSYNEFLATKHSPPITADQLEIAITPTEEAAFYDWAVFTPIRFDELPSGVDYAVADFAVNSGDEGDLDALRFLFHSPLVLNRWRMDDELLAALSAINPVLVVEAICNLRWARMLIAPDFTQPSSAVQGKIIGDGRAFRMSSVHRGAMEMLGFPPEADKYAAPRLKP